MAKSAMKVKQQRKAKFSTQEYSRCSKERCEELTIDGETSDIFDYSNNEEYQNCLKNFQLN